MATDEARVPAPLPPDLRRPAPPDDYASSAWYYDLALEPVLRSLRRAVRREIDAHAAGRVLDLGCGTGRQIAGMLHHEHVWGVDRSPGMLARARRQAPGRCLRADATCTPFPDGSFDLVYCQLALHEKPRPVVDAVLTEARRLLAPGGHLLVIDYGLARGAGPWSRLCAGTIYLVERFVGGEHYRSYRQWLARGGLQGVLEATDWEPVSCKPFWGGTLLMSCYR